MFSAGLASADVNPLDRLERQAFAVSAGALRNRT